jgi:hypothetical protein
VISKSIAVSGAFVGASQRDLINGWDPMPSIARAMSSFDAVGLDCMTIAPILSVLVE